MYTIALFTSLHCSLLHILHQSSFVGHDALPTKVCHLAGFRYNGPGRLQKRLCGSPLGLKHRLLLEQVRSQ